jgi:tRNA(fMet)-specific endonuclease VapC
MGVRVVDTDVWSYIYKGRDEAKLYEPHLFGNVLVISFQTQAELLRGAVAAGWGMNRRQDLESRLQKYVVEYSSYSVCLRWAEAMDSARRNGRPIAAADGWVAATALHLGVPLVTNNGKHFAGVDRLKIITEHR